MQTDAPKWTPGAPASTAPAGASVWSRELGRYVPVPEPRRFELHPIAETDPRFHALSRGERVAVAAAPAFLLWMPEYVEPIRHRGMVAIALDTTTHDSAPELWLDGKPYVFLRVGAPDPAWLLAHLAGRGAWFSYDGGSLHALRGFDVDRDGLLVVDLERVCG